MTMLSATILVSLLWHRVHAEGDISELPAAAVREPESDDGQTEDSFDEALFEESERAEKLVEKINALIETYGEENLKAMDEDALRALLEDPEDEDDLDAPEEDEDEQDELVAPEADALGEGDPGASGESFTEAELEKVEQVMMEEESQLGEAPDAEEAEGEDVERRRSGIARYKYVGRGVAGPEKWFNVYGRGVEDCYKRVMAATDCAKDYFSYVPRGDKNCGCKKGSKSTRLSIRGDNNVDRYQIGLECKVYLYQHDNYGGYSKLYYTGNYSGVWRNDDVSSIKVFGDGCKAIVYQHGGFQGWSVTLKPGSYTLTKLRSMGFRNDDMTSLKVIQGTSKEFILAGARGGYKGDEGGSKSNGVYKVSGTQNGVPMYTNENGCKMAWETPKHGWGAKHLANNKNAWVIMCKSHHRYWLASEDKVPPSGVSWNVRNGVATSNSRPVLQLVEFKMFAGASCGEGYAPITESWQRCEEVAKAMGYTGDSVNYVEYNYPWGTSRPQGCFRSDGNNRFHFNRGAGGAFQGNDKIVCQAIRAQLIFPAGGCGRQGRNLGTSFQNPTQCLLAARRHPECGNSVMWSPTYNYSWGCRCCAKGGVDAGDTNPNWRRYTLPGLDTKWTRKESSQCYVASKQFNDDRLDNPIFNRGGFIGTMSRIQCMEECSRRKDPRGRPCVAIEMSTHSTDPSQRASCALAWGCDFVKPWGGGDVYMMPKLGRRLEEADDHMKAAAPPMPSILGEDDTMPEEWRRI